MKKTIISLLAAAAAITGFVACDTDAEPLNLQPAYQYSEEYYANLRAYKESDHSICYLWFADYGVPSSPAYRFAGIPDSVDIVSLWGGVFPRRERSTTKRGGRCATRRVRKSYR